MTSPATRAWNTGCGAVAGPRMTAPSLTRNTLPCHGQVRQPSASFPSNSGPDRWLHRPASTCTSRPSRMTTTGTSPTSRFTGLRSGSSAAGIRSCQPGSTRCGTGSAWLAPPASRNEMCPPSSPARPAVASPARRSAREAGRARVTRDAAYSPAAAPLAMACTVPTRICCSCCSDQSTVPASAAGAAAASPSRTSRRDACSPPGHASRTVADSHSPIGACASRGCSGWPSHTPCRASRLRPGRSNRAQRWPRPTRPSSFSARSRPSTARIARLTTPLPAGKPAQRARRSSPTGSWPSSTAWRTCWC